MQVPYSSSKLLLWQSICILFSQHTCITFVIANKSINLHVAKRANPSLSSYKLQQFQQVTSGQPIIDKNLWKMCLGYLKEENLSLFFWTGLLIDCFKTIECFRFRFWSHNRCLFFSWFFFQKNLKSIAFPIFCEKGVILRNPTA